MEFLLAVILITLFIRWMVLRIRFVDLEQKIDDAVANMRGDSLNLAVAALTQRVSVLERDLAAARRSGFAAPLSAAATGGVADPPVSTPVTPPVSLPVTTPPLPFCKSCGRRLPAPEAICACLGASVPPPTRVLTPAPEPEFAVAMSASPTLRQRLREKMGGEEWEAIVGGSLLNKLGALVLVIGIALFLGYSFTQMGPGGRAATGQAVSLTMLIGGIVIGRRERYRIFSRGLIGGGWAALYFTTYAMAAIKETKVIDSPWLGAILLMGVATGMIVHSLQFRSEAVTALSYFIAFITLAITPVTMLSVVALVPLAASLLYISQRFSWSAMAVFGLVATYGTYASRGDGGALAWQAQTIFTIYWLLFEGFDLLRANRRTEYSRWDSAVMPLNAMFFVVLTFQKWSKSAPDQLYLVAASVAGAYLLSALWRTRLRPPSSFDEGTDTLRRVLTGGYEGPVTLTAMLAAASMLLKFHGAWASLGLLVEAELFFAAGLVFRQAYLRQLAACLFLTDAIKLLVVDIAAGETVLVWGRAWRAWAPVTALGGVLAYINRFLRTSSNVYGYAACAVFALIIGVETPARFLGLSWFLLGAITFAFGYLRRLDDFRHQGYGAAILGLLGSGVYQASIIAGFATAARHAWVALSASAILSYAGVWCALKSPAGRLHDWEHDSLRTAGSWAATVLLAALAWRVLPEAYVGVGWLVLALPLLELGLRELPREFEAQAYTLAGAGAIAVFILNIVPVQNNGMLMPRLIPAEAALAVYLLAARVYRGRRENLRVVNAASAAGTGFLVTALWCLLPAAAVGPAWAVLGILLVEVSFLLDLPALRAQGHGTAGAAFGRLFFANFVTAGATAVLSHRLATVLPVAAAYYHQWSRQREEQSQLRPWEASFGRCYLYAGSILVFALIRFELGHVRAVAGWAAFALILLFSGERWNISDLRWQSYLIALIVFWRSIVTSFDAPESFAGAAGRIALGAVVITCLYAAQLLVPRGNRQRAGLERHARLCYSLAATLIATVLLYHEVSGRLLTLAWGVEAVALLAAGFPLMDRVLRLSGLCLFLLCILKLFFYDLRNLETMYRILSFIALGLILLGVSWIYTRFRAHIQRYL